MRSGDTSLVSPELVLVDPELAARLREAWDEHPPPELRPEPGPPAEPVEAVVRGTHPSRRRLGRVAKRWQGNVLAVSLFVNGLLVSFMWNGGSGSVATTLSGPTSFGYVASSLSGASLASAAESAILHGLDRNATLRRLFADPSTGVALPGVLAHCDPPDGAGPSGVVHCVVWRITGDSQVTRQVQVTALPGSTFRLSVPG
jgi:hypothetical protein